jgi:hypothetical protein
MILMENTKLAKLGEVEFRRLTGFRRETFEDMLVVLRVADEEKMRLGGRPHKKSIADRLFMACQYWREYRTYFHIAVEFEVAKSTVQRTIEWVENVLIKSGKFSLPGKKKLTQSGIQFEVVLIDATETPICRPKKNKNDTIRGKNGDIR